LKPARHTLPLLALTLLLVAASMMEWDEQPEIAEKGVEPAFTGFRKVDDYPLYVLHYEGDYGFGEYLATGETPLVGYIHVPGCTVFTAMGGGETLMGRNFDFPSNPALLLYTDPPDGYASVSMVDLGYFGYSLSNLPQEGDLDSLLAAPYLPFDGMNEKGLAVGMAAIPEAVAPTAEGKTARGEIQVIRLLLDYAGDVDEALTLLEEYNVEMTSPPIHYMIADGSGESVVVEYIHGEMHVLREEMPYQVMTNYIIQGAQTGLDAPCWRYRAVYEGLSGCNGVLSAGEAMDLLSEASQSSTIWSIVYDASTGEIHVAMGHSYENIYTFSLDMTGGSP
jgi:predicted choloylglycine hydrolase